MIPSAVEVLDGWAYIAQSVGLAPENASAAAVRAALIHARQLAARPEEEPAAMFYAFAVRPRAFRSAWRSMTRFLARRQALDVDLRLRLTDAEADALCGELVYASRPPFEVVRTYFAERLEPFAK